MNDLKKQSWDMIQEDLSSPVFWVAPGRVDFWSNVWISEEFKMQAKQPGWLKDQVIPLLASTPVGWFLPPAGSRFYFSAWLMNAIMMRQYDNPLIRDLYILHEALHIATLTTNVLSPSDFATAIRVNEIQTSLETEAWVYLRHPEWIGKTFDPLWINQEHIRKQLKQQDFSTGVFSHQEKEWFQAAHRSWPISRPNLLCSAQRLWWVRRQSALCPQTQADQQVQKYDRYADRWIKLISPNAPVVQAARSDLKKLSDDGHWQKGVQAWSKWGASHRSDLDLPFGHLVLKGKP